MITNMKHLKQIKQIGNKDYQVVLDKIKAQNACNNDIILHYILICRWKKT